MRGLNRQQRREQRSAAIAAVRDGMPVKKAAAKFGFTLHYLYMLSAEPGQRRPYNKAARFRAVLRELADLGLNRRQISALTGRPVQSINAICSQLHIKTARDLTRLEPVITASRDRASDMAALYATGITLEQIGAQYGITRERVRQLIGKYRGMNGKDGGQHVTAARNAAKRLAAQDAKSLAKRGCTVAQYRSIPPKATNAYVQQKRNAGTRGIGWEFNIWQWWSVWQSSGHWGQRGRGIGKYVMCRRGDEGPYSPANVFIATCEQNSSEGQRRESDLPIGVYRNVSGTFSAHRAKQNLGTYQTVEQAHAAYVLNKPLANGRVVYRHGAPRGASGLPSGVYRRNDAKTNPYRAYIYYGSKQKHLGSFPTVDAALEAYLAAKAIRDASAASNDNFATLQVIGEIR